MARNARALGGAAAAWVDSLPQLVAGLRRDWGLTLGRTLHGGTSSYVAEARTAGGLACVLKVAMTDYEPIAGEVRTLEIADGRGYARLLAADLSRGALLTERLGEPLSARGEAPERQMQVLCATLRGAWRPVAELGPLQTGAEKAAWHAGFAPAAWEALGRPCPQALIDAALTCAQRRGAAHAPETSLLLHGDPHAANALADPLRPGAYRMIDPDGLVAEPAFDLGALLRDWTDVLLAGDPLELGRAWCGRLGALCGVDAEAIWDWAMVERVSTGLLLIKLGDEPGGRDILRVAEAWSQWRA